MINKAKKRVLIIAFKSLNADPRIIREVNVLLDNGYTVDHICVSNSNIKMSACTLKNFNVYSIRIHKKRSSLFRYFFEYCCFFLYTLVKSTVLITKYKYKFIQVFTMPEMLVFCAIAAKMRNIRVLMDWEDPSYELFLMKFKHRVLAQLLLFIEKISVSFVDHVITPNSAFKEAFIKRGNQESKIDIVLNAPDTRVFKSDRIDNKKAVNSFEILFNGSIFHRHGLHIGIEAIALVKEMYPKVHLVVVSEGELDYIKLCKKQISELKLDDNVTWNEPVKIEAMPDFYNKTSIVIIPNIKSPFTSINFPQRIFECGIMRKPVVVSRLPGVEAYMPDNSVQYFEPENIQMLADAIIKVCTNKNTYQSLVDQAWKICNSISWENEYLESIENMINK